MESNIDSKAYFYRTRRIMMQEIAEDSEEAYRTCVKNRSESFEHKRITNKILKKSKKHGIKYVIFCNHDFQAPSTY